MGGDKEKPRIEHEASDNALHSEARPEHGFQSDSEAADQSVKAAEIPPSKDKEKVVNMDYRNAKPQKRHLKKINDLTVEQIRIINENIRVNPVVPANSDVIVATVAEAFERVNVSLSMAKAPEVFAEDDENYYFSGGLSVDRVDDFSSGIRISKNGGAIHVWPSQP